MQVKESKSSWYLKCLGAFLITYGAFFVKFPHYVTQPNNQTFFSNGDLLVTLSDMIYHVRYDKNGTFTGMNYPQGDYIFMTDANGSFATVFRWIDSYLFDIDTVLPGILMSIIFLLIGLCGMFIFMIFRTMGIRTGLALILAPLVTLLSPQMVRIACHLSLSFPFVIPMAMLWTLRKYRVPNFELWDLVFAFVTFFFFMNNAYIGFIMSMFVGVVGFVLFVKGIKNGAHRIASIIMMVTPIVITLIVYILLKINDPYTDRLEEQWGFFYYHTKPYSLFYPKYSFIASLVEKYATNDTRSIEWTNNLGIIPMVLILSYWIYALVRRFKKELPRLMPKDTMMNVFLWAAFLMFLFASNTALFPIKNLIESYMGPLLMFKSSGRFSWPLYFVVALFSARILQAWVNKLDYKKAYLSIVLLIPVLLFYAFETNFYLDQRFAEKDIKNYLTSPQSDSILKVLEENRIHTDTYQGMFVLPLFVGWNEKIRAGVYNRSEEGALTVFSLTGIPMINGRLSRNSTTKTLQAVQMSSHPILDKEVLDLLPNNKPILLIQGTNIKNRLSVGEKALKDIATEVFRVKKYIGYRVEISEIRKLRQRYVNEAKAYLNSPDNLKVPLVAHHYDDAATEHSLFGQGALPMKSGDNKVLDFRKEFAHQDTLKFTAWTEITSKKYGMPEFYITVLGPNKYDYSKVIQSREHKNVYKNWIRSEHLFPVPKGENWIEIVAKVNQTIYLDEVNLSFARDTIVHTYPDLFLIDNYPVIE